MVNLMCRSMELRVLLKFLDLIYPGGSVDVINIPDTPLD